MGHPWRVRRRQALPRSCWQPVRIFSACNAIRLDRTQWRKSCCKRQSHWDSDRFMKDKDLPNKNAVERYVLRFRGAAFKPPADVERILASKGITVLDDSSPRMLLVEAGRVELKALVDSMPGWIMTPERTISLPDPRPRLRSNRGKKKQDM
jgi:hypothetical protein